MTSIFGLNINDYKQSKSNKVQDHKYITALEGLKKQFIKAEVNGDINLKGSQIRELGRPTEYNHSATKNYVDQHISDVTDEVNKCVKYDQNAINLDWKPIQNVRIPLQWHDAISKFYFSMFLQQDDTNIPKLIQTADVLKQTIQDTNQQDIAFFSDFCICLDKVINLRALYHDALIRRGEEKNMRDLWKYAIIFKELKAYVILLIENLSIEFVIVAEEQMISKRLIRQNDTDKLNSITSNDVDDQQDEFPGKRFKRFINKQWRKIDPKRNNRELEILVMKNLLILDIGFVYFIERLLELLVHSTEAITYN